MRVPKDSHPAPIWHPYGALPPDGTHRRTTVQKIGRTKKGVRRSKLSYLGTKIYYFAQETGKWGMMERSIY